jgi:hypothetical protein
MKHYDLEYDIIGNTLTLAAVAHVGYSWDGVHMLIVAHSKPSSKTALTQELRWKLSCAPLTKCPITCECHEW